MVPTNSFNKCPEDRNFPSEKVFRSNIIKDHEWDFSEAQLDRPNIYNPGDEDFPGAPKPKTAVLHVY